MYTARREDALEINNLGVTGNLVLRLSEFVTDKNYCLFTDRFYTSVDLVEYLHKNRRTRMWEHS